MALMHCTNHYFKGEEVTVRKGLEFSLSRLRVILTWSLFAATIGTILKAVQENADGWARSLPGSSALSVA